MFVTLGEGWSGFGPKQPEGLTPKMANIVPGSPIALEGMPPTDGLLADGHLCAWWAAVYGVHRVGHD